MCKSLKLSCAALLIAALVTACGRELSDGHIRISSYKNLSIDGTGSTGEMEENVWDALISNCTVISLPEEALSAETEKLETQYGYVTYMSDRTAGELIEELYGMSPRELAEKRLIKAYAVALIAEKEGLTLSEEEYRELLDTRAAEKGVESGEAYEKMFGSEELRETFLRERVMEFLIDHAKNSK